MTPSPPLPPRKNVQGLPPTHLHHLRSLIHQFLSQQLAPPDEGLPGPSNRNRVPDRPLWTPERLAEIEQAIWRVVVKDGGNGRETLLGCDWDEWARGSRLRKRAWKREQLILDKDTSGISEPNNVAPNQPKRGVATRLPMTSLLPSALSSATSTPMKGQRSPSVASSMQIPVENQVHDNDHHDSDNQMTEWSNAIKTLQGYLPVSGSGRDPWKMLDSSAPLRTPIRELPGAFPQSHSPSAYFNTSHTSLSSPLPSIPKEPLPPFLKPVICVSFIPSSLVDRSGSVRSQSTLRSTRESSIPAEGNSKRNRRESTSASACSAAMGSGSGSGGLGNLGGWFGNKWSEMTVPAEEKVEIEFVGGRFALPRGTGRMRRRSSTIRKKPDEGENRESGSAVDTDEGNVTDDNQESGWSRTEHGRGQDGTVTKNHSENVVLLGLGLDIPLKAAARGEVGVVGGTFVIRGIKREEERRGIERVFKAIIYTVQSHTLELSLLDAFAIPRELDPPLPPPIPPKSNIPTNATRPSRPGLMRAVSSSQGRKGFLAKLGLGPSETGKGVGRGMWDGLMGKRRVSQAAQLAEIDQAEADEVDDGLRRSSSVSSRAGRDGSTITVRESPAPQPAILHPLQMGGIERHLYLLADLRRMLHSTTPGMVFPLPGILLRVEEEDRVRRDKAGDEIRVESGQGGLANSVTSSRHTVLSTSTSNTINTASGIDGLPFSTPMTPAPRSEDVRGRALGYRLGGDLRSGLASLAINLDGWEGWCRLQKTEYVFWMGVEEAQEESAKVPKRILACTKPTNSVHRFHDSTSDISIEEYLSDLADEIGISLDGVPSSEDHKAGDASVLLSKTVAQTEEKDDAEKGELGDSSSHDLNVSGSWEPVCARPECGVAEKDHLRIWASGSRRLVGKVVKTGLGSEMLGKDEFTAQVKCDSCGAESEKRRFGHATSMSWSKFLELIMYTSLLINPELCSHACPSGTTSATGSTPIDGFTYILSTPSLCLRLTSETQPVLDTRLPKLQVGPLVAKRKTGSEAAKTAAEAFVSNKSAVTATVDPSEVESPGMRLPGSSVIVRDEEPASVIAYALSSLAYFNELCGGSARAPSTPATSESTSAESSNPATDPQWSIVVSRRDTPRDIHPLRALTKKRSELSLPSAARLPLSVTPNAPSLELNIQPVSGLTGGRDGGMDDLVKSIGRATAKSSLSTTTPFPRPASTDPVQPTRTGPPSISSVSLSESEISIDQEKRHTPRSKKRVVDEAPPSSYRSTVSSASISVNNSPRSVSASIAGGTKTPPHASWDKENRIILQPTNPNLTPNPNRNIYSDKDKEGWGGSVTSSFTSSFNTLLKLGTDVTDSLTARVRSTPGEPSRSLASILNPLHLSPSDPHPGPEDTRPHIHLDLSHPRHKISCTIYFASAFDTLRRRCAFDRSFVRSLERSIGWMAEGGKSKANFWKTEDGRLVVKTLVTKWNVSDLQALLEIAPAYFEHMSTTHNKATALAKIMGFYTIKIHDVHTNEKRSMDLLVMENLFWKQEIDRTFDLKGIEARRVPKGNTGTTMFDAEWLEGQAASPLFIHPYAKRILLDSLCTDTRFLSNQYIVDYSLLLGLDKSRSELVVGLVDAVGSYGLFKNIESMGKIALNRGREGEVTIIPPDQYRERFENALRSYFIVCPDKWSRRARRTGTCFADLPAVF